jgi:DNA repair exonuclease SbcCD ATPase subunit
MQIIDIGIDKIEKIFHIADVHVRNVNRHKEYVHVFKKLYTYIQKYSTDNSIIYVAGDIVHAKTDMSPELVFQVSEFFRNLADIAPTIIITGNHDCNLNNSNRLDALSPIVKALNHHNIHYLKDNGIYNISNVHFNVMSVFEKPINFIKANEFEGDIKIALHHGAVNSAVTDIGFQISNEHVTTDIFKGHDLTLLGDIHKPAQFLNDEKTIAYAGSLIQQNHGEGLLHGILEWDIPSLSAKFIEIKNLYGYYTFEIDKGKILNPSNEIPPRPRLRLKVKNTNASQLKKVVSKIRKQYKVQEISIQKIHSLNENINGQKISFGNVRDVEWQNNVISEYLTDAHGLSDTMLDVVRHINRTVHSKLTDAELTRNVTWIPRHFEFSNMFSYGEDNIINFANIHGTNGLFAANASGKSTLLDSLAFCCFDRCSRTVKAAHVLNNKKSMFHCKFHFELDGKQYFIERRGKKQNNGHVKVNVDFWRLDSNGNKVLLNGDQRDTTNKIIKKYIGSYDDFILTALSLQNNNTGFIDKSQRERKELLTQFLDIDVFEKQYQIAAEDIRDTSALIREYKRNDFATTLSESEKIIDQLTPTYNKMKEEKTEHDKMVSDLNDIIINLTSELITISKDVISIEESQHKIDELKNIEKNLLFDINKLNANKLQFKNNELSIINDLKNYDIKKIETIIKKIEISHTRINEIENQKQILNSKITHASKMVEKLDEHKWDPNCEYCIANPWLKDTQKAADQLPQLQNTLFELNIKKSEFEQFIGQSNAYDEKENFYELQDQLELFENKFLNINKDIESLNTKKDLNDTLLQNATKKYNESKQHEKDLKFNLQKQKDIDDIILERDDITNQIKQLDQNIQLISGKIQVAEESKKNAIESIERLAELEKQYKGYEYYLQSIKRDGVPYKLITKALPQIETEVNNILTQVVDFNMILKTDGKNINGYIIYDDNNYWPLELTSGMEKFICSLAIRTSLINITSLPRPNFLAIDEGFGVLDSENISNIYLLFDYLKSQFGFIMCISHIDTMRDVVDKLIEIKKTNGYSKINYS